MHKILVQLKGFKLFKFSFCGIECAYVYNDICDVGCYKDDGTYYFLPNGQKIFGEFEDRPIKVLDVELDFNQYA